LFNERLPATGDDMKKELGAKSAANSEVIVLVVGIAALSFLCCLVVGAAVWYFRDIRAVLVEPAPNKIELVNKNDGVQRVEAKPIVPAKGVIPIDYICSLALTPDNRLLAAGLVDHRIRLWDYVAQKERAVLAGHNGPVHALAISPDGKYLASGGRDQFVRLWDIAQEQPIQTWKMRSDHPAVAFTPDSQTLIVAGADEKEMKLWDLATLTVSQTIDCPRASALALTPDGKHLAAGGIDASVWELATGKKIAGVNGHRGIINAVALTPDAKTLVTASADNSVKIWDTATSTERKTLSGHDRSMNCLVLTPNGKILAAGSSDGKVSLWEVETGKLISYLMLNEPLVSGVAITNDGKTLLTSAYGGRAAAGGLGGSSLKVWDLSGIMGR
jgi:WD40 repeat protein